MQGNIIKLFLYNFHLGPILIVLATLMLQLSAMCVKPRKTLVINIASAIIISVLYEGMPAKALTYLLVFGYRSPVLELSNIIDMENYLLAEHIGNHYHIIVICRNIQKPRFLMA